MYHGNLAALLARPASRPPVLWNIRQSLTDLGRERPLTALAIRAGARLSPQAARIIYNSRASARQHEAIGYDPRRTVVIPNGFDTARFQPALAARDTLVARLGVGRETIVVGHVARFHPMKNHLGFLRAAAMVVAAVPRTIFVLAGQGVDSSNRSLTSAIARLGLTGKVHLLGALDDVPALMAGLDLLCSPSGWGEGFPNVLGEALAAGVPCVATDVGDSAWIVGGAGLVVPPGDDAALAAALTDLIRAPSEVRKALGVEGRRRVQQEFTLEAIAARYEDLYLTILAELARGIR
jgi:glycosyltransferase involved in cell wall biosynthesis